MTGRTPWPDARAAAYDAAEPLETVAVPLPDGLGATLGKPLRALAPLPPFDAAAMDGYAVAGSPPWTIVGRVLAGESGASALRPGEAVEIATGAPVPTGTESVLPYEEGHRDRDTLGGNRGGDVAGVPAGPRHIRRVGEDCPAGVELLPAGSVVTPIVLGLAASTGHDILHVRRAPRVAALVTGDELLGAGRPGRGRVRDAVGPFLPGLVRWAGGTTQQVLSLPDDPHVLAQAVKEEKDASVVVVCGASSAGPADHLRGVLEALGARALVDGVACRPGHPQTLGRVPDGRFVVGLPGNPFAALVAALTLLVPLLAALCGRSPSPTQHARLAGRVSPHPRDTRLIAVSCRDGSAYPTGHDRPALLWGAACADALAVIPPGGNDLPRGAKVEVLPLPC